MTIPYRFLTGTKPDSQRMPKEIKNESSGKKVIVI